jgi:SPP1 gp7 family putative phage head morphogenesis protein
MANNEAYWAKRSEYLEAMLHDIGEEFDRQYARQLLRASDSVQKEIEAFYARFGKNNEILFEDARRILTGPEKAAYQMSLEEYVEKARKLPFDDRYIRELENASTVHRATRLQVLQFEMRKTADDLIAKYDAGMTRTASRIYTEGYHRTIFELNKGTGFGVAFDKLDDAKIRNIVSKPWLPDGKNFSERIWGDNRAKLVNFLENDITNGMIRGQSIDKLTRAVRDRFNVSKSDAARLIRTESAYFASVSTRDAYMNQGVREYEILATLDYKTSEICQEMDGKVFATADYRIGVTAPPFHCNCRTTTVPYFEPDEIDAMFDEAKRAARDENGKYYLVPADMKYSEWHDKYVLNKTVWRDILGTITATGAVVANLKPHFVDRHVEREVPVESAIDALEKPLDVTEPAITKEGLRSVKYIGEKATVAYNPDTDTIITTWPTGRKTLKKLRKKRDSHENSTE